MENKLSTNFNIGIQKDCKSMCFFDPKTRGVISFHNSYNLFAY